MSTTLDQAKKQEEANTIWELLYNLTPLEQAQMRGRLAFVKWLIKTGKLSDNK